MLLRHHVPRWPHTRGGHTPLPPVPGCAPRLDWQPWNAKAWNQTELLSCLFLFPHPARLVFAGRHLSPQAARQQGGRGVKAVVRRSQAGSARTPSAGPQRHPPRTRLPLSNASPRPCSELAPRGGLLEPDKPRWPAWDTILGTKNQKERPGLRELGATPVGIKARAGRAALLGEKMTARWRHCLSARSYQSHKGTKETAGVNGPNLLLLQLLITRGAARRTACSPSATRSWGKTTFHQCGGSKRAGSAHSWMQNYPRTTVTELPVVLSLNVQVQPPHPPRSVFSWPQFRQEPAEGVLAGVQCYPGAYSSHIATDFTPVKPPLPSPWYLQLYNCFPRWLCANLFD